MIGMTVCSGIGAPEVAAPWIDWRYQSEIEPFPCAVLKQRFPDAINLGDMTKFKEWPDANIDVLCGGTPCQSFSIAGLRKGLADPRGNLALTYLAVAERYQPSWLVWENVPGVLSALSHEAPDPCPPAIDLDGDNGPEDGEEIVVTDEYTSVEDHALWCFMAGASELGYHGGFIHLDAQHIQTPGFPFAVPQRRDRLFFVGYLGDWTRAAAVLLDAESLRGNSPPRREAGKDAARTLRARANSSHREDSDNFVAECAPTLNSHFGDKMGLENQHINQGGGCSLPPVAMCLNAHGARMDAESETLLPTTGGVFDVAHTLKGEGFDASEYGTGRGTPIVPVAIQERAVSDNPNAGPDGVGVKQDGSAYTLEARSTAQAVAFDCKGTEVQTCEDGSHPPLRSLGHHQSHQNAGGHAAVAFDTTQITSPGNYSQPKPGDPCHPLAAGAHPPAVAFAQNTRDEVRLVGGDGSIVGALAAEPGAKQQSYVAQPWAVRRLTPTECERLMGFPDGWTAIEWRGKSADQCPDGPRYKALGNSWAVNSGEYIFDRIKMVEEFFA